MSPPLKLTLIYVIVGCAWILFSDRILYLLTDQPEMLTMLQTTKGWLYIAVTALLIYGLIAHQRRRDRAADRELRESRHELATTLASLSEGVIATDMAGRVIRVNPAAESICGRTQSDLIGQPIETVLPLHDTLSEQPVVDLFDRIRQRHEVVRLGGGIVLERPDGSDCPVAVSGAVARQDREQPRGMVLVLTDLSTQQKLQEDLRHAHKMESIGMLAGGVAHDFNNLLTGIMGYAELLREMLADDPRRPELAEFAEAIRQNSQRAADLTQQLLVYSRRRKPRKSCVDLHEIIRDVIKLLQRTIDPRIEIRAMLRAERPSVIGDPTQLQNALLNLAINARDAMREGGVLTIRTLSIEAADGAPEPIQIQIHDTGHGIPHQMLEKIFDPFFTTKEHGTGLGLAAVNGTVRTHGGEIEVTSHLDEGTTFTIRLPGAPAEVELEANVAPGDHPRPGQGRILFVDDEQALRNLGSEMLTRLGCEVVLAEDGQEAVQCYTRERDRIDLIVMDIVMPRASGRQAIQRIRAIDPHVPILVVSGYMESEDLRLEDLHIQGTLVKPFSMKDLCAQIARHLPASPSRMAG